MRRATVLFGVSLAVSIISPALAQPPVSEKDAENALRRAVEYYRKTVASHGGYVYYYSLDLKDRWGEGRASPDILFVQPPGTPTVGMAFLKAYQATGDSQALDAAREAAECLVQGQLASGGWTQVIHFAPARWMGKYRNRKGGDWNVSSLDDGQTQSALEFLMRIDAALNFKHSRIHEAVRYGLEALLAAQFPNGAFPQVWTQPVSKQPVVRARYPDDDWRTEGRLKNYWDYYTLNDNLAGSVSHTLMVASDVYKDSRCQAALEKLGDFLLLAQMPEPQPAWCQQYNYDMVPIWARKFEPAAVTGWESQDVLETLIRLAEHTGNKKYLKPIPRALEYLEKSLLPDGQIARFYELKTNIPLYMNLNYELTHDDSNVPPHYGWKQPARLDSIRQQYERVLKGEPAVPAEQSRADLAEAVKRIVRDLDAEGRWVSTFSGERLVGQPKFAPNFRYLSSEVFSTNVETLSEYLSTARQRD